MANEYQEYPRTLYRGVGVSTIVHSDEEKAAKLAEGWQLTEHASPAPEPAEPEPVPVRRGRKPKADA